MGLIASLLEKKGYPARSERRQSGYEVLETILADLKRQSSTGVSVSPKSALRYSAVFACVRVLSETVASLPLIMYERQDVGRRRAPEHHLYPLLHDAPNPMMTALEYRETLQAHLATWGNAYSQIEYDSSGRVTELWPLRPDMMYEIRIKDGLRWYHYQRPDSGIQWIPGNMIWHLRGLGSDGYIGYSPIKLFRQSIGLGLATEEFGARFFANDARPGIVLTHPSVLSDKARENLEKGWEEEHGGLERSHRMRVLEEGLQLKEVGIPPEDAQFLQTRKFQVTEIARIYRVPPHMIADLEKATFSNIEHQGIEFVVHTLRPWLVRWEQSIRHNLMLSRDWDRFYPKHLVDGLLRGDTKSRYDSYAVGRQNGWLSANDIRELEDMNPISGGDIYLIPLNMIPAPTALGDKQESARAQRSIEGQVLEENSIRSIRSATARHRLREAYLEVYRDTATRILRKEAQDISKKAHKLLRNRNIPEWNAWIEKYYQDHAVYIKRQMSPVNHSYVQVASAEAQEEISVPVEMTDELIAFADTYTGTYTARHVGISEYRLKQALIKAENSPDIEPDQAIDEEVEGWEEGRSGEIAEEESTRLGGAVAKTVFIMAGFTKFRWVAIGDSCPYCNMLNGKIIGIDQDFLVEGESLQPEGYDPLTTSTPIGHPPAHSGCDCMIAAER